MNLVKLNIIIDYNVKNNNLIFLAQNGKLRL